MCNTQILMALLPSFTEVKSSKIFVSPIVHVPKWGHTAEVLPPGFGSHTVNTCSFHGLFSATFFFFLHFHWWFCHLKLSPNVVLTHCLMFLSARRLWCALWRKEVCSISFILAWLKMLLAMSSVLRNQQYTLNEVSLNRNKHETRLCIDHLY